MASGCSDTVMVYYTIKLVLGRGSLSMRRAHQFCSDNLSVLIHRGVKSGALAIPNLQLGSECDLLTVLPDTTDRVVHNPLDMQNQHRWERLDEHLLRGFGRYTMSCLDRDGFRHRRVVQGILDGVDVGRLRARIHKTLE